MAVTGHIKVDVTKMERVKLLVAELQQISGDLKKNGQRDFAVRIDRALWRLTLTEERDRAGTEDDTT